MLKVLAVVSWETGARHWGGVVQQTSSQHGIQLVHALTCGSGCNARTDPPPTLSIGTDVLCARARSKES